MGKNKRGKKNTITEKKIVGIKKLKAKPVVSNLKRLNQINKAKTADLDKGYSSFRNNVIKAAKDSKNAKTKPQKVTEVHPTKKDPKPEPDIDVTMADFSKLL